MAEPQEDLGAELDRQAEGFFGDIGRPANVRPEGDSIETVVPDDVDQMPSEIVKDTTLVLDQPAADEPAVAAVATDEPAAPEEGSLEWANNLIAIHSGNAPAAPVAEATEISQVQQQLSHLEGRLEEQRLATEREILADQAEDEGDDEFEAPAPTDYNDPEVLEAIQKRYNVDPENARMLGGMLHDQERFLVDKHFQPHLDRINERLDENDVRSEERQISQTVTGNVQAARVQIQSGGDPIEQQLMEQFCAHGQNSLVWSWFQANDAKALLGSPEGIHDAVRAVAGRVRANSGAAAPVLVPANGNAARNPQGRTEEFATIASAVRQGPNAPNHAASAEDDIGDSIVGAGRNHPLMS